MKYLKLALFSFICGIVFGLAAEILSVEPVWFLSFLSGLACLVFLLIWLCTAIFHRFRHSLNVIVIIIFFALAVVSYLLQPSAIQISSIAELSYVHYTSLIWIASGFACCISILVLIARLIFARKPVDEVVLSDTNLLGADSHSEDGPTIQ